MVRRFAIGIVLVVAATPWSSAAHSSRAASEPTTTVYLPNITKMLGGPDGWQTPFIVQNVGTAPTDITMDFYGGGEGRFFKTRTVTGVAPGTSVVHDPNGDPDLGAGWAGSVVVRSFGAPIVAVVNEHQNVRDAVRQEALSYSGISAGSTMLFLPYLTRSTGGWLTTFIVQNMGASFATATVQFQTFEGPPMLSLPLSMAPGRSQFVDLRFTGGLADGLEYSAVITSDQPIGAVVNAHHDAPGTADPMGFSYNGIPASSAREADLPYFARRVDGRSSRIVVQNVGTSAATPTVSFYPLGSPAALTVVSLHTLQPGMALVYSYAAPEAAGEYSVRVTGGQFAAVSSTIGNGSAMGYASRAGVETRLFLPNITRRLGGPAGWSTPIYLQSTGARSATVSWYRFADGALVFSVTYATLRQGMSLRIDPRDLSVLADDTQYAVVIESDPGGVAAIVNELNTVGGDGAMQYEAFPPPLGAFGASGCSPAVAPAGTTYTCRVYGLNPGSTVTFTMIAAAPPFTDTSPDPVAADGSWTLYWPAIVEGRRTITVTAAGVSKTVDFTVTAPTFAITITQSRYGFVAATTLPGLACSAGAKLPTGTFSTAAGLDEIKIADGSGQVSWSYATTPGTQNGTGHHFVVCTKGSLSPEAEAAFSVP